MISLSRFGSAATRDDEEVWCDWAARDASTEGGYARTDRVYDR